MIGGAAVGRFITADRVVASKLMGMTEAQQVMADLDWPILPIGALCPISR